MILLNKFTQRKLNKYGGIYYIYYPGIDRFYIHSADSRWIAGMSLNRVEINIVRPDFTFYRSDFNMNIHRRRYALINNLRAQEFNTIYIFGGGCLTCETWPEQKECYKNIYANYLKRASPE